MTAVELAEVQVSSLPALIDRAARALVSARSSAEILEAKTMASVIYDLAKKAARIAEAKGAHDTLIATAHRAQADALEIEAGAKRRLADEYDWAQERGEIRTRADNQALSSSEKAGFADLGLTGKDIHEARKIRDAEAASPGIIERAIQGMLERGEEPSRANLKRELDPYFTKRANIENEQWREQKIKSELRAAKVMWNKMLPESRELFRDWLEHR